MTTPALGDGRLVLEPLRVDHAAEMVDVLSDAGLYAFTGGSPPSRDELERRYERQVTGSGDTDEVWHTWVVRLGDGGPAVGYIQATVRPAVGSAELAWSWVLPGRVGASRARPPRWCSTTCGPKERAASSRTCTPTTSPRSGWRPGWE